MKTKTIQIDNAPKIEGLRFRTFAGEEDYPKMAAIINRAATADKDDEFIQVKDIQHDYAHLTNSDPETDVIFAEIDGESVAYSRVNWYQEEDPNDRIYSLFVHILPEWRNQGIEATILGWCERRLKAIASEHPHDSARFLQTYSEEQKKQLTKTMEELGYKPVRYGFRMSRSLEDIPEAELPEGIEVRPVKMEDTRKIWKASVEAFRDHWGFAEPDEDEFESYKSSKYFQPDLWQVAWEGDEVVSSVMNFINHDENEKFNRKLGWTENISTRREWRRKGIARALIVLSMHMHKALGMTRVSLGVDTQNPNGALQLYKSLGYLEEKTFITLRKEME